MAMSVSQLRRPPGNSNYYTRAMRRVIENHLPLIASEGIERVEPVNGRQYDKYQGDFYGLLIEHGVKPELHWPCLRVNGLHSPADWVNRDAPIFIVMPNVISDLLDQHLSTQARL